MIRLTRPKITQNEDYGLVVHHKSGDKSTFLGEHGFNWEETELYIYSPENRIYVYRLDDVCRLEKIIRPSPLVCAKDGKEDRIVATFIFE